MSACITEDRFFEPVNLVTYETSDIGREAIFFDPLQLHWRDGMSLCRDCTQQNGYYPDGSATLYDDTEIEWISLQIRLLNELDAPPPEKEVANLMQAHYAEPTGRLPAHVREEDGVFFILVPVLKGPPRPDFLSPTGYLRAHYTVLR